MVSEQDSFTPIRQPYSVGAPVRERAIFFGRQDDFNFVRERLLNEREGMVLSLVGPRRSGKTSIMFQILNGELGEEFLPIFIDMQQMASVVGDREFFSRMAVLCLENLNDERLVPDYYDFAEGNPILTFDGLLADIQQGHPDRRLLFLIDEAEILESKIARQELGTAVLTYMSSILENRQISFCLTGSPGMISIESEDWRRLTAKGDSLEISFLSPGDSERLVREPVAGEVDYEEGVVESIYELTAGWPFYIQLICFYLVVHLNHQQRRRATAEDIVEVVRAIVDNPPPQIVYQWDELSPNQQITLALLGEQSTEVHQAISADALLESIAHNSYPLDLGADGIKVALEELYAGKHLQRTAEGSYYFRVDLFRQWAKRYRSVWRLVGESETASKRWPRWAMAVPVVLLVALVAWWALVEDNAPTAPAALVATTGQVWVEAMPRDVRVLVDGTFSHDGTPTLIRGLAPGLHTVRVEHEDYHAEERQIEVGAGRVDTVALPPLQRLRGSLSVVSTPVGAQLQIEGEVDTISASPLAALDLPTGTYRITVSQRGYVSQTRQVQIAAGEKIALTLDLVARIGGVTLSTHPAGAQVFLDGQAVAGRTPLSLEKVAEGPHIFRFELKDYRSVEKKVSIVRGRTIEVVAQLKLLPATIVLKSNPAGAEIRVDDADSLWGTTPATLSLVPGRHRITLSYPGYDSHILAGQWRPNQRAAPPVVVLERQYGFARIVRPLSGALYANEAFIKKGILGNIRFAVGDYTFRIGAQNQQVHIFKDSTVVLRFE